MKRLPEWWDGFRQGWVSGCVLCLILTVFPGCSTPESVRRLEAESVASIEAYHDNAKTAVAALVEAYHSAKGNTKASTAGGTEDYIDYAVSSYERDFSLSLTELERKQLLLVEEALGRIRRDEYGRCLNCGVAIPQRRLEVEAWARYCIQCQELQDRGEI